MKLKKKVLIFLAGLILANMCAVALLLLYLRTHPGNLPMWIPLAMFAFLTATCVVGGVCLSRFLRGVSRGGNCYRAKRAADQRRAGLKIGLVLWSVIFMNGVLLTLEHTVLWQYAVPALAPDFLFIVTFWTLLNRIKRSRIQNAGQTSPKSS